LIRRRPPGPSTRLPKLAIASHPRVKCLMRTESPIHAPRSIATMRVVHLRHRTDRATCEPNEGSLPALLRTPDRR
jgi:hypothetical protein